MGLFSKSRSTAVGVERPSAPAPAPTPVANAVGASAWNSHPAPPVVEPSTSTDVSSFETVDDPTTNKQAALNVGIVAGNDRPPPSKRALEEKNEEKSQYPAESFVPLTIAKSALVRLDERATTFKTVRIAELEELRAAVKRTEDETKAKYVEHYTRFIGEVRTAAKERIALLEATAAQRRRVDGAMLVATAAAESARAAAGRGAAAAELAAQRGALVCALEDLEERRVEDLVRAEAEAAKRFDEAEAAAEAAFSAMRLNLDAEVVHEAAAIDAARQHEEQVEMAFEESYTRAVFRAQEREEAILTQAQMTEEEREAARAEAVRQAEDRQAQYEHRAVVADESRKVRSECEAALRAALNDVERREWADAVGAKDEAAQHWAAEVADLDAKVAALQADVRRLDDGFANASALVALETARADREERAKDKQTAQIMPLLTAKEDFEKELIVKRAELDNEVANGAALEAMYRDALSDLAVARAEFAAAEKAAAAAVAAAAEAAAKGPSGDDAGPFVDQLAKVREALARQTEANAQLQKTNAALERTLEAKLDDADDDDDEELDDEAVAAAVAAAKREDALDNDGGRFGGGGGGAPAPAPQEGDGGVKEADSSLMISEQLAAGGKSAGALRIQLRMALASKKQLRAELAQLRSDVLLVNQADDDMAAKSRDELRKLAKHAQLQSEHTHEELARAQTMITQMKQALQRAEAGGGGGAAASDLAEVRAELGEAQAELTALRAGQVAEDRHTAAVAAHAAVQLKRAEADTEVFQSVEDLAEANRAYANVATELAKREAMATRASSSSAPAASSPSSGALATTTTTTTTAPQPPSAADQEAALATAATAKDQARAVGKMMKESIVTGTTLWKTNKRAECFATYKQTAAKALEQLPAANDDDDDPGGSIMTAGWVVEGRDVLVEVRAVLDEAATQAEAQTAARGAVTLRKAFDKAMQSLAAVISWPDAAVIKALEQQGGKNNAPSSSSSSGPPPATAAVGGDNNNDDDDAAVTAADDPALVAEIASLRADLQASREECERIAGEVEAKKARAATVKEEAGASEGRIREDAEADRARIREAEERAAKLEAELETAQSSAVVGGGMMGGGVVGGGGAAAKKKLALAKKDLNAAKDKVKKLEVELKEAGKRAVVAAAAQPPAEATKKLSKAEQKEKEKADRASKKVEKDLASAQKDVERLEGELKAAQGEIVALKGKIKEFGKMSKQLDQLKQRSEDADRLEVEKKELGKRMDEAEAKYMEEMKLRKKYYNQMEDMKGKIRVFCRCRPMAQYELQKGCHQSVQFVDETTLIVTSEQRGPKEFMFDSVFPPNDTDPDAGQSPVFEDVSHLIQSCMDGFNVCIFAYGQTGSGKTFTMTGVRDKPELRGVTPRAIHLLFETAAANAKKVDVKVSSYFLELYNDAVVDLYEKLDNPNGKGTTEKLEIKVDAKKMVFVKGSVIKPAASADELLNLFEAGNTKRHVGATKMNAESSRSHSIFAILVECYDKTTKKTSVGKLSLVDLAGSERADKTGATADRLKEAQAINKSLSALGDVIAALSSGEKHIPYRNNKLTMLMQDSLGGNAKTLMFVNISPADYNTDETVTSLTYAARVKLIKNNANKNAESEEVAALKAIIKNLKAGGTGEVAGIDMLI